MADAPDLGSDVATHVGSNPSRSTKLSWWNRKTRKAQTLFAVTAVSVRLAPRVYAPVVKLANTLDLSSNARWA